MKYGRGFTIIELLIVVVVIAILAAITLVAYNGIQSRAKDAATDSAVQQVKSALELYRAEQDGYPAACSADNSGCAVSALAAYLVPDYISALPSDPGLFQYVRGTGAMTYAIYVKYAAKPACKTGMNVVAGWWGTGLPTC